MEKKKIEIKIDERPIGDLVEEDYQTFSSYVARERLVPDVEDGLKPVYRRVILAAYEKCSKDFVKTATLAGHTLGYYHPHSIDSIEDVITQLVHMGVLEGDGAFGCKSLSGNHSGAASSRYTSVRLNPKYTEHLDLLLKYVPKVEGEMDNMEASYIPSPLPILCLSGSFSLAPALMVSLPAFTYKSMLEAYRKNDPMLLKSTYGYRIINRESALKQIWTEGKATIYYSLDVEIGDLSGHRGVFIKGSPELFIPKLDSIAAWKDEGLVFVNDISAGDNNALFIGINKGVRNLSVETLYKALKVASMERDLVASLALVDNAARPIGLRAWIEYSLTNFEELMDKYKNDRINSLQDKIKIMDAFDVVRKYIIDNIKNSKITAEQISQATKVELKIVQAIDSMSVKQLRSTDPVAEKKKLNAEIKEVKKINPTKVAEQFINDINTEPKYEVKSNVTLEEIKTLSTQTEQEKQDMDISDEIIG